ncbi:hypothetical protein [uncultured Mediterranean phage uvMED]|nr:hypothetical protein [uncultured Mediterranean phage uvMED]
MSLTTKERRMKLLECQTGQDFFQLYLLVFKEEVPETNTRNPNEELDNIMNAIYDNKKIEGVILPNNYKI